MGFSTLHPIHAVRVHTIKRSRSRNSGTAPCLGESQAFRIRIGSMNCVLLLRELGIGLQRRRTCDNCTFTKTTCVKTASFRGANKLYHRTHAMYTSAYIPLRRTETHGHDLKALAELELRPLFTAKHSCKHFVSPIRKASIGVLRGSSQAASFSGAEPPDKGKSPRSTGDSRVVQVFATRVGRMPGLLLEARHELVDASLRRKRRTCRFP